MLIRLWILDKIGDLLLIPRMLGLLFTWPLIGDVVAGVTYPLWADKYE